MRKQESTRLRQALSKDDAKVLKKTVWPFRKRSADLTTDGSQGWFDTASILFAVPDSGGAVP
jgi:hypothetical protein